MPHGIWKGTMGFGLVSIAVELLPAEAPETRVLDLMAALKRSVESRGKAPAPRRGAARRKTAARRSA